MKDTEIIQKLQKQYIETQQKRSKMIELIIRNNENNNYLSDKMIEGLFGLINKYIKIFEEKTDAFAIDLVYDYRRNNYYLAINGRYDCLTPYDLDVVIGENYDYFCLREALRHVMSLYEAAGYHVNEEQISLQKTEYEETDFWSSFNKKTHIYLHKQQYIYRWLIKW